MTVYICTLRKFTVTEIIRSLQIFVTDESGVVNSSFQTLDFSLQMVLIFKFKFSCRRSWAFVFAWIL